MKASEDGIWECFSRSYNEARSRFLDACEISGVRSEARLHAARGPDGAELATDIAWFGRRDSKNLLVLNSGTHGVEGLVGSGCQVSWMKRGGLELLGDDIAVLMIHMLNPWGAAWGRRQNEDNIDLNRNFLHLGAPLPRNPAYDALRPKLTGNYQASKPTIDAFLRERGTEAYATALFGGQYSDPGGIGFGGLTHAWSTRLLTEILSEHAAQARNVIFIDIHSGVGPFGYGALLSPSSEGSHEYELALRWFGRGLGSVTGGAIPYTVRGDICSGVSELLKPSMVTAVAIEFGTFELERLLSLQVDDWWLHHQGETDSRESRKIRHQLQEFFFPETDDWLEMVQWRSSQVIRQALVGLGTPNGAEGTK